jgi:hypothetical protein
VTKRAQGYCTIRREIDTCQRQFDREPTTLTTLRLARFAALERMYTAALLVAAAADEARIAVPEGVTSWVNEIAALKHLRDDNAQRLRAEGLWEVEPDAFAMGVPNGSPATGDLADQEQPAATVGLTVGTGNGWVDVAVVVVGDSDGDAAEIT